MREKVEVRGIKLIISDEVFSLLLSEGFSQEYGAREMDRVIGSRLKPLLMREILYGKLRNGGTAEIIKTGDDIQIK